MKVFVLILLFTFSGVTHSIGNTFTFTKNCSEAYKLAFQLRFEEANTLLIQEQKNSPENAAAYYVLHYIDFLKAFISEQDVAFEFLKQNIDQRLNQIEKVKDNNPWRNYARGEMLMQLAIVKLKNKEYISSGYYIRKSFKLIENNRETFPEFSPNLKALGFFHAVIGAVPENYKWLANLAGMKGTIKQGSDELTVAFSACKANSEYSFMTDDVLLLKIFIATHLEKNVVEAAKLIENYNFNNAKNSPLATFTIANTLMVQGKFSESLKSLNNYTPTLYTYPLYYLFYMEGSMLLNNLDDAAKAPLTKYVTNYKGKSFIKSAWMKIAWLELLNENEAEYKVNLESVLTKGNEFTDEDKQALKEAESGIKPNINLLKARLLFDGGNYNDALTALAGKPSSEFPSLKEQIEFTYRLARIFDKKEQTDKALKYYTKTYNNGKDYEWYFASNSALLIANYYEEKGKKESAVEWYKKCLALRNHEYQNSIDQKAEAGLNRLGKEN